MLVDRLGGRLVGTYAGPEVSGYRRDRPSLYWLLADVRCGAIDVVVCEALDSIARDGEDISWVGNKLRFDQVKLHTATEGEIDKVKRAVAGLLGSMFQSNPKQKTLRGMKAAVLAGGEIVRSIMEISEEEAEIVRRILRKFADGRSSLQIATGLNLDGIPGPRGGEWNASTVRGAPHKHVGILTNPLYLGQLVWSRREWRKDLDSDRRERLHRLSNPPEWVEVDVPDLRIVDPDLAKRADAELQRRARLSGAAATAAHRRSRHLLSGPIVCGRAAPSSRSSATTTPGARATASAVRARMPCRSDDPSSRRPRFHRSRSASSRPSWPRSSSRSSTARSAGSPPLGRTTTRR